MSNLITQAKGHGYTVAGRALMVGSLAIVFIAGVLALGIVPTYLEGHSARAEREAVLAALRDGSVDTERTERQVLSDAKKRAAALQAIGAPQRVREALELVVVDRTKGITLRSLTYTHKDDGSTLILSGKATDANVFKAYTAALKSKSLFQKVSVPLSSLANLEGGDFSLTLSGSF